MLYKTLSAVVYGIDASIIQVEVNCSGIKTDQDHFHTVTLPDADLRESRDRIRAALKNCGYDIRTHEMIHRRLMRKLWYPPGAVPNVGNTGGPVRTPPSNFTEKKYL